MAAKFSDAGPRINRVVAVVKVQFFSCRTFSLLLKKGKCVVFSRPLRALRAA